MDVKTFGALSGKISSVDNKAWNGYQTTSNVLMNKIRVRSNGNVETRDGFYCSKDLISIPSDAASIILYTGTSSGSYTYLNDIVLYDVNGSRVGNVDAEHRTSCTINLASYPTAKFVGFTDILVNNACNGRAVYTTSGSTSEIALWTPDTGSTVNGISGKQDKLTSTSDVTVKTITLGSTSLNETQLQNLLALLSS